MNKYVKIGLIVVAIVASFLITKHFLKPDVNVGKETIVTKVINHTETLTVEKIIPKFVTKYSIRDTFVHDTVIKLVDSTSCFQAETTFADGAHVKTETCSKYFVPSMTDVSISMSYVPAPDTIKEVFRTDTLVNKPRFGQKFAIGAASFGIGVISGTILTLIVKK